MLGFERIITLIDTAPSLAHLMELSPSDSTTKAWQHIYVQIRKLAAMKGFPVEEIDATIRRPDLKCLADIVHTFGLVIAPNKICHRVAFLVKVRGITARPAQRERFRPLFASLCPLVSK